MWLAIRVCEVLDNPLYKLENFAQQELFLGNWPTFAVREWDLAGRTFRMSSTMDSY